MVEFGNALKLLVQEKPLLWLATPQVRDPAVYSWLSTPETLQAITESGAKRLYLDLPQGLTVPNEFFAAGQLEPQKLEQEVAKVLDGHGITGIAARDVADLMKTAREKDLKLRFLGDPARDQIDEKALAEVAHRAHSQEKESASPLGALFLSLAGPPDKSRELTAEKVAEGKSGVAQALHDQLQGYERYLGDAVETLNDMPAGERAVIVHTRTMPTATSLSDLLGPERVNRLDVGETAPQGWLQKILPQSRMDKAPRLSLAHMEVDGLPEVRVPDLAGLLESGPGTPVSASDPGFRKTSLEP